MEWSKRDDFLAAPRWIWHVNSTVAGYVRSTDNLTYLVVNGAGHFTPNNQPQTTLDMFSRFIDNEPFATADPEFVQKSCSFLNHCGEPDRGSRQVPVQAWLHGRRLCLGHHRH